MPHEEEATTAERLLVGLVFAIGVVLVYWPQHLECWRQQSSEGFSLSTILISTISTGALVAASGLSDYQHYSDSHNGILYQVDTFLPTIQNVLGFVIGIPSYVVYYWCFPHEHSSRSSETAAPRCQWELVATGFTWFLLVIFGLICYWDTASESSNTNCDVWIKYFGTLAAVTNTIQWIPQIVYTYQQQDDGILADASIVLAVLGDLALGIFWIANNGESAWVYGTLAADAASQTILLLVLWDIKRKKRRSSSDDSLRETLLSNDNDDENQSTVEMDVSSVSALEIPAEV